MIRVQGQTNGSHDPKLKVPLVASAGARAAAERTVSTGEIAALRKEIAALTARVAALEVIPTLAGRLEKATRENPKSQSQKSQSHAESQSHEPWKAAGVSRSTWFRKHKAKG